MRGGVADKALLARWRREGYGIWRIILVVIGWDEAFGYALPGKLSETFATALAKEMCAKETGEHPKHMVVQSTEKIT